MLTDGIVREILHVATVHVHPLATPTASERLSVLAVGGYGRAEMAPYSDVDLLFLTPWKTTPWAESVVESMLYMFWDLHLKVGHATRTVKDCLRLGRDDFTIRTALLEHRHIDGDEALAAELKKRLRNELFKGTGAEFIEAKLAERTARHKQAGRPCLCGRTQCQGRQGRAARPAIAVLDRQVPARRRGSVGAGQARRVHRRGIRRLPGRRGIPAGHALPPASADRPGDGPADLRPAGRCGGADGLCRPRRPPRRRAFHAGLFPPRHPRRRDDPDLPHRSGTAPRQERPQPGRVLQAEKAGEGALHAGAQPAGGGLGTGIPCRQAEHARHLRGGPAHRLSDPPRCDAAGGAQPGADRRPDARRTARPGRGSSTCS